MDILIYIGKVSLYWTLFYMCYLLFLRKHTFFVWNRIYLIGSLLISFALPFIIYPESAPKLPAIYEVNAATATIATTQTEQSFFTTTNILWMIYGLGLVVMMYKFYKHVIQLRGFLKEGESIELDDCEVVLINSNHIGSFSFLNWIVVNRNDYENHFDAILRHEMVHMQQKHTVDVLLIELLKIVFWFNPILIFYKKSLQEVHEFLADAEAPNRENYAKFLVSYALNAPIASLTNHFFKPSQIKTRIQMIYKNRTSKWMLSSYLGAIGMIGTVALVVAGCERNDSDLAELNEISALSEKTVERPLNAKKIYTVVEQQPLFPGGVEEMYKFLGRNIKYPTAAANKGISGRVFLSFTVTETGDIEDITILKGIGYGCDAEAVRVVKSSPKWLPGKQDGVPVNVKYNLPINFQIEEADDKSTSKLNSDASDEVQIVNFRDSKATSIKITEDAQTPLYVIDGKVQTDPNLAKSIKPENIASVSVLKDEKALVAYGDKGKNGVIEIVTK